MIPLGTPPGVPTIQVLFGVISADVPDMMGMYVLDQHSLTPYTVSSRLIKTIIVEHGDNSYAIYDWHVHLTRSDGHLNARYSVPALKMFTTQQLTKLHRQFFHPSSEKRYNLLRKVRPEDTTPETQK